MSQRWYLWVRLYVIGIFVVSTASLLEPSGFLFRIRDFILPIIVVVRFQVVVCFDAIHSAVH